MSSKKNFYDYREKILGYAQKELVSKFPEIQSCDMRILPEHSDWDIDLIFLREDKHSIFRKMKDDITLEKEIRKALLSYCKEIGAEEYYLFIYIIINFNFGNES